jgi:triosephosphate isomerase
MVIFNLKTYPEATGSQGDDELEAINKLIKEEPKAAEVIFIAPQVLDLLVIRRKYPDIHLLAQHVDPKESGKTTGSVTAERLLDIGVDMSMLNHSEHRLEPEVISVAISYLQKQGLKLIVCAENMEESEAMLDFNPFAIAYEPKQLIGSGKSVSTHKVNVVQDFVKLIQEKGKSKVKAIIGAGVTTGADVAKSKELGADGVLISSAFALAQESNKLAKLKELVNPYLT